MYRTVPSSGTPSSVGNGLYLHCLLEFHNPHVAVEHLAVWLVLRRNWIFHFTLNVNNHVWPVATVLESAGLACIGGPGAPLLESRHPETLTSPAPHPLPGKG